MPYNNDICKLVIENIALLEEAPLVIAEIQEEIFKAINKKFKGVFEKYTTWEGFYSYFEEGDRAETRMKPNIWPSDEVEYQAYYEFIDESDECEYYLTALFGGKPLCKYAISFYFNAINLCGMNKRTWKDFLKKQYNARPDLKANGVQLEGGECLSISIRLDPKAVAAEYPDFDECLKPIDDAINALMKVHPLIDEIVQEALRQNESGG